MAKHSIQITDSKLYESIVEYCKENGLKVSFLCTDMLRKQFLLEKFGDIPFGVFQDSSISYDDKSLSYRILIVNLEISIQLRSYYQRVRYSRQELSRYTYHSCRRMLR